VKRFLLFVVLSVAGLQPVLAGEGRVPLPELSKGKGDACVEATDEMRRNHMRYLLHQRDDTMRKGIRTKKHSLKECIDCHVQNDKQGRPIPVNAPGQFCQSCHDYAAVSIDCFQCHSDQPTGKPMTSSAMPGISAFAR